MINLLKKAFDFFVFSSLFIAVCAVLMVLQTYLLFQVPVSVTLILFVFCGSVCSYNFHWFLTPPHVQNPSRKTLWNINYKYVHLALATAGLIGAAITAFLLIQHWFWLGVTAFLTFLYTAPKIPHPLFTWLRKIALAKTIFLAFAWTHITVLLPLLVGGDEINWAAIVFTVNRFFFLYAICIVFDRRDVEDDKKAGIQSLITFLDEKGIGIIFWGSVIVAVITNIILLNWFSGMTCFLLFVPVFVLILLYQPSKKNSSDYLYYFTLDGLMALSASLLILIKFVR